MDKTTRTNVVPINREYLSAKEIEAWLGISYKTIYRWKEQRILPHVKLVGAVRFRRADIENLLARGFVDAIVHHE